MTSHTITALTGLVQSKAITVKLQTFCFFTITKDFFVWVDLFGLIADITWFGRPVANFYLLLESVDQILRRLTATLLLTLNRRRVLVLWVLEGVAWSIITRIWTLHWARVIWSILSFRLENNFVDNCRLIGDQSLRLLHYWGVYLNVITWVTVIWAKDVLISIIGFGRERDRR